MRQEPIRLVADVFLAKTAYADVAEGVPST